MAANGTHETTLAGRVVSVNEKGLKLDGEDSWRNFSKFAQDLVAPSHGDVVSLTLDKAGFVRACGPADGSATVPATASSTAPSVKDRTITRLAVLKAAAEFAASKPDSTSAAVLRVAEAWEKWVMRPDAVPEPELDEAFWSAGGSPGGNRRLRHPGATHVLV